MKTTRKQAIGKLTIKQQAQIDFNLLFLFFLFYCTIAQLVYFTSPSVVHVL